MRLSRIRQLASLFFLLAILSAICLCLRSLWLVSCPFYGNHQNHHYQYHDENAAAAQVMFHQHHHEWRGQQQDATADLTLLLERKHAKELDALRREKEQIQQYQELRIANLTATIQEQAIELETIRCIRHPRDHQQQQVDALLSPRREQQQQQLSPLVFDTERSTSHAIFYNIYIPPLDESTKNTEKMDNALRIVEEQISQVKASFVLSRMNQHDNDQKKKKVVPLFYNTIGHAMNATWMNQLCTGGSDKDNDNNNHRLSLDCIFLNHYNTGSTSQAVFEDVTLQRVLDYCQSQPHHHDGTVIYMHSKGSFNPRDGSNDVWRRHLTNAVTSRECLLATTTITGKTQQDDSKQCNVCGLLFNPMPGMHFPGNFFTARCSYVQNLPPPATFQKYMQERVIPQVLARRLRKTFEMNLYPALDPWMHGVDRWAFEWWIASHPFIVPCDVSVQTSIYPFKEAKKTATDTHGNITDAVIIDDDDPLTTFAWAMAPRFSYRDGNWDYTTGASRKFVMRKLERRRTEYALLAGHLFRWIAIYNNNNNDNNDNDANDDYSITKSAASAAAASNNASSTLVVPPDDSWIWEWFPEGQFWRDQVRKYGLKAVNVTTAGFAVF